MAYDTRSSDGKVRLWTSFLVAALMLAACSTAETEPVAAPVETVTVTRTVAVEPTDDYTPYEWPEVEEESPEPAYVAPDPATVRLWLPPPTL